MQGACCISRCCGTKLSVGAYPGLTLKSARGRTVNKEMLNLNGTVFFDGSETAALSATEHSPVDAKMEPSTPFLKTCFWYRIQSKRIEKNITRRLHIYHELLHQSTVVLHSWWKILGDNLLNRHVGLSSFESNEWDEHFTTFSLDDNEQLMISYVQHYFLRYCATLFLEDVTSWNWFEDTVNIIASLIGFGILFFYIAYLSAVQYKLHKKGIRLVSSINKNNRAEELDIRK